MLPILKCFRSTNRLWWANRCATNKPPSENDEVHKEKQKVLKKKLLSILSGKTVSRETKQPSENLAKSSALPESSNRTESKNIVQNIDADQTIDKSSVTQIDLQKAPTETKAPAPIAERIEINYSELTEKLKTLSTDQRPSVNLQGNVKNLLHGVVIEKGKEKKPDFFSTSQTRRPRPDYQMSPECDIFSGQALNIFPKRTDDAISRGYTENSWQQLEENEIKSAVYFAPTNAFEEMIMWTEQGIHWKFPIDNEIDLPEENISFDKHVFLEQQLEGFPDNRPIRHFMELVTAGLSKNPYITVDRKIENIEWFRDYFEQKKDILE